MRLIAVAGVAAALAVAAVFVHPPGEDRHTRRSGQRTEATSRAPGRADGPPAEPGPVARVTLRDFDRLWRAYDRTYPYFPLKGVDWDEVRERLRPRAVGAEDAEDRLAVLSDLLATLRDGHATLRAPDGRVIRPWSASASPNWSAEGWTRTVEAADWHRVSDAWGWARFGDVGYAAFSNLQPSLIDLDAVDDAFERLRGTRGLILDLRMNAGGDDALALALAGRFTNRRLLVGYLRRRNGRGLHRPRPRWVGPEGRRAWSTPVVVLAGGGTLSSAETLVAALSEMPHVTIVGDTTGGSSGHPTVLRLSGGWEAMVPRYMALTASRTVVEDRGIPPDRLVPFEATPDGDPLIAHARRLLDRSLARGGSESPIGCAGTRPAFGSQHPPGAPPPCRDVDLRTAASSPPP
jgi:hypothetical protein